jgi:hypothetical protein
LNGSIVLQQEDASSVQTIGDLVEDGGPLSTFHGLMHKDTLSGLGPRRKSLTDFCTAQSGYMPQPVAVAMLLRRWALASPIAGD